MAALRGAYGLQFISIDRKLLSKEYSLLAYSSCKWLFIEFI